MSLPLSPDAHEGPVIVRAISERTIEICDGIGRKRLIQYQDGKIVRMETTIAGPRGLHERVDQRKEGRSFVSAFVEPGRVPRVVWWRGEILVRAERGLVNYVTVRGERLYETADGRTVQERTARSGAQIFTWLGRDTSVRTKQIHDAAGRRHFLAYDRIGLAKIRLDDGTELTRGAFGLWENEARELVRRIEVMEDGSIRWTIDRSMFEVRGDGTRAFRTERDHFTEFVRLDADGRLASSIRVTSDPTGIEKTVIRDAQGIVSIRVASPRRDSGYDLRTIERRGEGSDNPRWRISAMSPPGKSPELDRFSLLPAASGESRYVIATIDDREDGIVYSFPDLTGMFLERCDGRIERVA